MNIKWIKIFCINNLVNKNDCISLHPLLSIKLVEGLNEIVFRLRMKGKKKRLNKPENLSHFFGRIRENVLP